MKKRDMKLFEEAFRKAIKNKRIELGKTQEGLSEDIDMSYKYIGKLERGQIGLPSSFTLFKMFYKESISIDELFSEVLKDFEANKIDDNDID